MSSGRLSFQVTSKFIAIYTKLFEGLTPHQISPHEDSGQFFSNLFNLDVKDEYLRSELDNLSKDSCLGRHKPLLNTLFRGCLVHARSAHTDDIGKAHALQSLSIIIRCILRKNFTGWEVMEILGGGVGQSDDVFMTFTALVNDIIGDESATASIRHQGVQVALIYMCAIGQLSPGAYFLRRDLFPAITTFIKTCDNGQSVSEAVLLLAILANFHKSDAARLNPYLQCIRTTRDTELMRKICSATSHQFANSIRSYQDISDDSVKKSPLATALGSMFASLRPDRALLSITTPETPREAFKNQPAKEAVFLLPVFELLHANRLFPSVMVECTPSDINAAGQPSLLSYTILTLSSYILTHASSTFSSRSLSYANLSLHILLALVESDDVMTALTQPGEAIVPICRQRLPHLPIPQPKRPPLCTLLDCCVLWFRHNLHKRLEVYCFINCIHVCYRVVWYLQNNHLRLEYYWKELWVALLGLLNFLTTKIESLDSTGGVERIVRETVILLELSLTKSESYLPSPGALHEFIYELVRSAATVNNQVTLLETLTIAPQLDLRQAAWTKRSAEALVSIIEIVDFYGSKVNEAGARTAKTAMAIVAREIEVDGLYTTKSLREFQVP